MSSVRVVTAPTTEPVTLSEARAQCRGPEAVDDAYLQSLIAVARDNVQTFLKRSLMPHTRELVLDYFPMGAIALPFPPVSAVSAVLYTDAQGVDQTWATTEYDVDLYSSPARIAPKFGKIYPIVLPGLNRVRVQYACGYADASLIPPSVKQGMLMLIAHLYENREATVIGMTAAEMPFGVASLLTPEVVHG